MAHPQALIAALQEVALPCTALATISTKGPALAAIENFFLQALIKALQSGKIAAAGLDVFQTEPGGNPAFATLPNVFMLPHLGSSTRETRKAMGDRALDNLDAFFAGEAPRDRLV